MTKERQFRRIWIAVAICVVLWYVGILLLPKVDHGELAFPMNVEAMVKSIATECATFEEAKAKAEGSGSHWQDPHRGNDYRIEITPKGESGWTLLATPEEPSVYYHPLWKRLLFLDFSRYGYPKLKAEGGMPEVSMVR